MRTVVPPIVGPLLFDRLVTAGGCGAGGAVYVNGIRLWKLPSVLRRVNAADPATFGGVTTLYACHAETLTGYVGSSTTDGEGTEAKRSPVTCGLSPDWLCTSTTIVSPPVVIPMSGMMV